MSAYREMCAKRCDWCARIAKGEAGGGGPHRIDHPALEHSPVCICPTAEGFAEELAAKITSLSKRAEQDVTDAARLDWLIHRGTAPTRIDSWAVYLGDEYGNRYTAGEGKTPRQAIDDAIQKEGRK